MKKLVLALLMNASVNAAEVQPTKLTICVEDKPVFHLYNSPGQEQGEHPGILIDYFNHLARKNNLVLEIIRRPATACRVLVKANSVNAYGIISHTSEREELAVYPRLPNGQVDTSQVFTRAGYYLYARQEKALPWDGKNLDKLKGLRIGSSEGYSINDELRKAGVIVETFKSQDAMFTRLHEKQLDGLAIHSNRIDKKISKMGLRKYEAPLKMNDYYITFSRDFYRDHKTFCEKAWKDSINFEQSPDGKKAMERYETIEDFPRP